MSDQFCEECGQEPQCAEGFGRCPSCHARLIMKDQANEIAALKKENEELRIRLQKIANTEVDESEPYDFDEAVRPYVEDLQRVLIEVCDTAAAARRRER